MSLVFWEVVGLARMEMDRKEIRAVIKYLFLKKMSAKEIHADMAATLGDISPSYYTVKEWCAESRRG